MADPTLLRDRLLAVPDPVFAVVDGAQFDALPQLDDDVLRAVRVPIAGETGLFVATVVDEHGLDVPLDAYQLEFRLRPGKPDEENEPHAFFIELYFASAEDASFEILRKSGEMTSDTVITRTAQPAI